MMIQPPTNSTLFPYTTLFRSSGERAAGLESARLSSSVDSFAGGARSGSANGGGGDRKSTRLNSSHPSISYAVFCLKKEKNLIIATKEFCLDTVCAPGAAEHTV